MKPQRLILGLAAAALLGSVSTANATFVLGTGNPGNTGTDNVIVNACTGNTTGPASLVQGCLNTSHTTLVNVSTNGPGSLIANGGQARFDHSGSTLLDDFAINFADSSMGFTKIIFNINGADAINSNVTFTVNAVDQFGNIEAAQVFNSTISGNGQNFFSLTSTDGEVATRVSAQSSLTNIEDIRQVRLGGVGDVPVCTGPGPCGSPGPGVPEPATLFLLGSALLGYGALRRRQQRPHS